MWAVRRRVAHIEEERALTDNTMAKAKGKQPLFYHSDHTDPESTESKRKELRARNEAEFTDRSTGNHWVSMMRLSG